jgi:hypothetical protein
MCPLWGERAPGPRRQPLHYGQEVNPMDTRHPISGIWGHLGSGIWEEDQGTDGRRSLGMWGCEQDGEGDGAAITMVGHAISLSRHLSPVIHAPPRQTCVSCRTPSLSSLSPLSSCGRHVAQPLPLWSPHMVCSILGPPDLRRKIRVVR